MGPLQHIYRLVPSALPGDLTTWLLPSLPPLWPDDWTPKKRRGVGGSGGQRTPPNGPQRLFPWPGWCTARPCSCL